MIYRNLIYFNVIKLKCSIGKCRFCRNLMIHKFRLKIDIELLSVGRWVLQFLGLPRRKRLGPEPCDNRGNFECGISTFLVSVVNYAKYISQTSYSNLSKYFHLGLFWKYFCCFVFFFYICIFFWDYGIFQFTNFKGAGSLLLHKW